MSNSRRKTVVVTGSTGFVGRHVVARLLDQQVQVRCLVRENSDRSALEALSPELEFVVGDITQPESLESAFAGAWGVINAAGYRDFWARNRKTFYALNETGATNVFQACLSQQVEKVVQVSTPLAYGVPKTIPFSEESTPGPHPSDYGRSKYRGDRAGLELRKNRDLPLSIVYLAAVIGAGDDRATMEVRRAVEKKLPALVGANTTYTYVYIRDAAEAVVRALMLPETVGERYLIGTERASTKEYFEKIGSIADVPVPAVNIPEKLVIPVARQLERVAMITGNRPVVPLDIIKTTAAGSLLFDGTKAVEALGMNYTSLDQALAESVDYIREAS